MTGTRISEERVRRSSVWSASDTYVGGVCYISFSALSVCLQVIALRMCLIVDRGVSMMRYMCRRGRSCSMADSPIV